MNFLAKYKPMVFPGEFILDAELNEVSQLTEQKAKEVNIKTAHGATHIKTILCIDCKIRSATDIYKNEYCCSTCKNKKELGL